MFKFEYLAANLGVDIEAGGLSVYETPAAGLVAGVGGVITLPQTPVTFAGSLLVWYKEPSEANWSVGTAVQSGANYTVAIPGAAQNDVYCVKFFYQNEDARSLTIATNYVPKVLHLVIMNDLYSGDSSDVGSASRYGRIITDIPNFQLDGSQDLSLTSTSAATVSLTGSALAVDSTDSCESESYYGTMTEEIFGSSWEDNVMALAIANSDIELSTTDTETLAVYAVFGGMTSSQLKDNSNFTFAVESGNEYISVNATTGVVSATAAGTGVVSATLTGTNIVAYATVTVPES